MRPKPVHPPVVLIDPDPLRRRELSRDLAAADYEVVPAVSSEEGRRFTSGLGAAVVVVPLALARESVGEEGGSLLAELRSGAHTEPGDGGRTVVLLDERKSGLGWEGEEERGQSDAMEAEADALGESVFFLPVEGLETGELFERIHLVLIGRELGIPSDWRLGSLVGDLAEHPLLDILRRSIDTRRSARVETERGWVALSRGQVTAAEAGPARGVKAVCRLARLEEGPFRIHLGPPGVEAEIADEPSQVVVTAIEDTLADIPNRSSRLRLVMGTDFFSQSFSQLDRDLLAAGQRGAELGEVLDGVPLPDGVIARRLAELEERGLLVREEPLPAVRVVTDSTSDLTPTLAREAGITVVPLSVHFGKETFLDRVEIAPGDFYKRLQAGGVHPSTSPPAPETFAAAFRNHLMRQDVVALHLSARLSETCANAVAGSETAAKEVARAAADHRGSNASPAAHVVDSGLVSMPLGLLALFASRMAARGADAARIVAAAESFRERFTAYFVVDTLEYLARGGRIGKARALFGNLLGIKPILTLEGGQVAPFDKVRGGRAAHPRILEHLKKKVGKGGPVVVGIAHATAPVWADRLRGRVEKELDVLEIHQVEMGPVVGAHVGIGTVGVCIFQPTPAEWVEICPLVAAGKPG